MSVLVVAEKPSVARDIAAVVGATRRGDGYLHGDSHVVTWAIGHLVALAEPHEMNASWKRWRAEDLPLLPPVWPLVVIEATRAQFDVVRGLLHDERIREVVCATDAGREGELIFRYLYEAAGADKPVRRLWISSLTPGAIAQGLASLKDGAAYDRLADAARARSRADWLVGMNLSRAYSLVHDDNFSVGRVQTPTLAMLVQRELDIRGFVPEDYLEVVATFGGAQGDYQGTYTRPAGKEPTRLPADGVEAQAVSDRARRGMARIASVDRKTRRLPPPLLYDLTELQRHANRLYGFTAQRTLEIAQKLYEQRKLISYPRTDSRHLSQSVAATLHEIVETIAPAYVGLLAEGSGARPLGSRFVNDARVTDHHAILPTSARAPGDLPPDERRIYDLVCRRLLSAWHDDHVLGVTTVLTDIAWNETRDRYTSSGTTIEVQGWKVLDVAPARPPAAPVEPRLPGGLAAGMPRRVVDVEALEKRTRPPVRFTDGTLLTAMETAGQALEEKEISDAMRERGLGTPATRAAILETLLRREYVTRDGKMLQATDKGVALIERVHPQVKSPAMTGEWEARMARIERGAAELGGFMREIETYVQGVVSGVLRGFTGGAAAPPPAMPSVPVTATSRPARGSDLTTLLHEAFGFPAFRPYQEAVCRAAAGGQDVLLVMPTGAGKSLCYQLPGVARGGTTLVVSPLIALMDDQVGQLTGRGLRAERIHSGRSRLDSRAACKAYLQGELDFLFIAPERLRVPGFPEMLARRKPTLIAIDEAHCISQWGHDFRPDYRMLGERLPLLRPAPVIALTATATPDVQDDIARELRLDDPARFIHGFRRDNIGVEVIERSPGDRADVVAGVLKDPARRPAIVYAPTRREAEELSRTLAARPSNLRAAGYHAGLAPRERSEVQTAFLRGDLDVIVATTAFGMGIDKADVRTVLHTALPATVEGYYQEIGRAGRDGSQARAVLLHSFADTRTHEFFLERDYPPAEDVERVFRKLGDQGQSCTRLAGRVKLPSEVVEKIIEKLWAHGAARVDAEGLATRGEDGWREPYERQRAHKREQGVRMRRFAETASCRMLQLVAHFGDEQDGGASCGACDVCAPAACVAQTFRQPSVQEEQAADRILAALEQRDGRAVGQLHRDLFADTTFDRRALEHVLGGLARAGRVVIADASFVKNGETIAFQRVHLAGGDGERGPLRMVDMPAPRARGKHRKRGGGVKAGRPRTSSSAPVRATRATRTTRTVASADSGSPLENALRAWRTSEAKRRRVPAFRVLTDRTLSGLAQARPTNEQELLEVAGMGPGLVAKYGRALLALLGKA